MTWFKVDDSFHSHPKALKAGNAALGLWVRCGSYCAQHLTDGFIPREIALLYGTLGLATKLVAAGLWEVCDGGWRMHDWGGYNPSSDRVLAERRAAAIRQQRARETASSRRDIGVTFKADDNPVTAPSHRSSRRDARVSHGPPDPTRTQPEPNTPSGSDNEKPTVDHGLSKSPARTPTRGHATRGTRIPDDFSVTATMVAWARENTPHVDGRYETEKFVDYWRSETGKSATKRDWAAAWRNWMRRASDQLPSRNGQHKATSGVEVAVAGWEAMRDKPFAPKLLPGGQL